MGKTKRKQQIKDKDHVEKKLRKIERYIRKIKTLQERSRSRSPISRGSTPLDTTSLQDAAPVDSMLQETMLDDAMPEEDTPGCSSLKPIINEESTINNHIDTDILTALGTVENETGSGLVAHNELVLRWIPILEKGLGIEEKTQLFKQYTPFTNIIQMSPPKLNLEISAAVTEPVKKRDSVIEYRQKVIAAALAAAGQGLQCLLTMEKVESVKHFHNSTKILCELLHSETQTRRSLIQAIINKDMKSCLQSPPNEFLFGLDLGDKIRSVKAMQRSAQDLSRPTPRQPPVKPLNYRAPPQHTLKRRPVGGGKKNEPKKAPRQALVQRNQPSRNSYPKRGRR